MESMSAEIFLITHPRVVFFFFSSYQSIKTHVNTLLSTQKNILFSFKSPFSAIKKHQTVILLAVADCCDMSCAQAVTNLVFLQ